MKLTVVACCNPLKLEDACHAINVRPITETLRNLFWRRLDEKTTHTCLMCRLKLVQNLWISEPDRLDESMMDIIEEVEHTMAFIEQDLVRLKQANAEDSPAR